ncbi:putative ABC transporter related protein [Pyrodictium delaneyi]|uniref:Putative ABC transporter related protein n=1 Tax=Pyrodictium delaneyi TaxID=1273541 RepID=A0A0P0N5M3_9CREN|nr:ATP-binding cassette domain-containing protein [Pyrodictium delaneyi]ALL01798.1 putative ABC transporter related protein [Pyrodictium delaneyi]OWJ54985.1 hypothetical protein Pdsh_04635 [Pyrodictium delaneyi]
MLSVRDLVVEVEGRRILQGISMDIGPGELHVIMGPNGAGKSTLLNTIAGLRHYKVVSGSIIFQGINIVNKPLYERARSGIVLAHQFPPALKGLTLRELVSAMERIYGSARDVEWAADILDVKKFMDRPLFVGMSGGERKRVELYLTILQRPRVALLDEPDSGVDIETLERIEEVLVELKKRGVLVLLVSHTMYLLERLAARNIIDNVHVIVAGRLAASGDPKKIFEMLKEAGFQGIAEGARVRGDD